MKYSTIEEALEKEGHGFLQTVGDSMEPILHNRKSTVVVEKASSVLKKYDVALYRRPTGQYVLHRVTRVRSREYIICGDNRIYNEHVPKEWILGVMKGFYPDEGERFVSCEDEEYKKYLERLGRRYVIRWFKVLPGRIKRKLTLQ